MLNRNQQFVRHLLRSYFIFILAWKAMYMLFNINNNNNSKVKINDTPTNYYSNFIFKNIF